MSQAWRALLVSYIVLTRAERSAYSEPGVVPPRSEMGWPAAMRLRAKLGIRLHVVRARTVGSICTMAVEGVASRSQARPACSSDETSTVHGPTGLSAMFDVSCAL